LKLRDPIILASASPRRADLLTAAGFRFTISAADVDERTLDGESAVTYAERVAREKAAVVAAQAPGRAVLAADTVVVVDGEIFGKPAGEDDARRMLRALAGRRHDVLTAVCLVRPAASGVPAQLSVRIASTTVEFAPMSDDEIDWYVASGEPTGKAGAYAIQGLASRFVTRIDGSYSNVVGLPVALVVEMCREAGILVS
jgi:septum formation protein